MNVCVRRMSCAQLQLELLPPVLVRSELGYGLELRLLPGGGAGACEPDEEMSPRMPAYSAVCSNQILQEMRFMEGLPLAEQFRREATEKTTPEAVLEPGRLLGIVAPGSRLQLRSLEAQEWSLELPVCDVESPPFTTMISLQSEAKEVDTVLCVSHDLLGVPREDTLPPGISDAPLPQVLSLRPLLRFSNRSSWPLALLTPARLDAGPWQQSTFRGSGDPRQLRHLEVQVFDETDGATGSFSSGPLLLSGLTQFSTAQAAGGQRERSLGRVLVAFSAQGSEMVSWRNAVRCSKGEARRFAPVSEFPWEQISGVDLQACIL
ncbi:unnamed protein product [Effrenium voratum]|nr:unnamed protein product [Effrenium voratum]